MLTKSGSVFVQTGDENVNRGMAQGLAEQPVERQVVMPDRKSNLAPTLVGGAHRMDLDITKEDHGILGARISARPAGTRTTVWPESGTAT